MFHIFRFIQSDVIFGIVNPFKLKANPISSEESCQISMPFLLTCIDVRAVKFIPLPES